MIIPPYWLSPILFLLIISNSFKRIPVPAILEWRGVLRIIVVILVGVLPIPLKLLKKPSLVTLLTENTIKIISSLRLVYSLGSSCFHLPFYSVVWGSWVFLNPFYVLEYVDTSTYSTLTNIGLHSSFLRRSLKGPRINNHFNTKLQLKRTICLFFEVLHYST